MLDQPVSEWRCDVEASVGYRMKLCGVDVLKAVVMVVTPGLFWGVAIAGRVAIVKRGADSPPPLVLIDNQSWQREAGATSSSRLFSEHSTSLPSYI